MLDFIAFWFWGSRWKRLDRWAEARVRRMAGL